MNLNLQAGGSVELSEAAFGHEFNEPLVHQVVTAYLAGGRQGSRAQKSRSQKRGGGRKPWRQKGTGRARAGTIRSPLWRGGGVTFAAKPQNHSQKVNRKMYQGALRCILSELIRQERIVALESLHVELPKTKSLLQTLKDLDLGAFSRGARGGTPRKQEALSREARGDAPGAQGDTPRGNVLIVTEAVDENLFLAARNLKDVDVLEVAGVDPVSLIGHDKVLITVGALKQLEAALS